MPFVLLLLLLFLISWWFSRRSPEGKIKRAERLLFDGFDFQRAGKVGQAEESYSHALTLTQDLYPLPVDLKARLHEALGDVAYLRKSWELARLHYKNGLEVLCQDRRETGRLFWRLRSSLSFVRLMEGKTHLFQSFQHALLSEGEPGLPLLEFLLENSERLQRVNNNDLALAFLNKACAQAQYMGIEARPLYAHALRRKALLHYAMGHHGEALEALQKARALTPSGETDQEDLDEVFLLSDLLGEADRLQESYLTLQKAFASGARPGSRASLHELRLRRRLAETAEKLEAWEEARVHAEEGRKLLRLFQSGHGFSGDVNEEANALLFTLVTVHEKTGAYGKALGLIDGIIAIQTASGDAESAAESLLRKARLASQAGQNGSAMESLEAVRRIWENKGGMKPEDEAFLCRETAWVFHTGGNPQRGLHFLEEAEKIMAGNPDPETWGDLWDLRAEILFALDDPAGAEGAWKKAEEAYLEVYPKGSPLILRCLLGRVSCHLSFGEYQEALSLYEKVRTNAPDLASRDPWMHAEFLAKETDAWIGLGAWEKALPPAQEAATLLENSFGSQNQVALRNLWQLALVLEKSGELAEAEELCNKVLERAAGAGQEGGEEVFHALSSLAEIQKAKGDWSLVMAYAERGLVVAEAVGSIREEDRIPLRELLAKARRRLGSSPGMIRC